MAVEVLGRVALDVVNVCLFLSFTQHWTRVLSLTLNSSCVCLHSSTCHHTRVSCCLYLAM